MQVFSLINVLCRSDPYSHFSATFIYFQLPLGHRPDRAEEIIGLWYNEGKVRKEAINQAQRSGFV